MRDAIVTILCVCSTFMVGCQGIQPMDSTPVTSLVMKAGFTHGPVKVDGKLDEPIWNQTPVYPLYVAEDKASGLGQPQEGGQVQLAWDDQYFYIAVRFEDSDIVAEGQGDQLRHFELGDLCELFLKPENGSWYWELYATPRSKKTSFLFPGWGRMGLPGNMAYECDLQVAAELQGTLEQWRDRDQGWTAEMAMPIKDLDAQGVPFAPGQTWRILVARYNYSRYLQCQGPEYSMTPRLSQTNFHCLPEYATLELEK